MKRNVTIMYLLSLEGRKQSILNGGDGKILQRIKCDVNEKVIKQAYVCDNEDIEIEIGFSEHNCEWYGVHVDFKIDKNRLRIVGINKIVYFDKVMIVDELLLWDENRMVVLQERYDKFKRKLNELVKRENEAWTLL